MTIRTTVLNIFLIVILLSTSISLIANDLNDPSWMCGPISLCNIAERYGMVLDKQSVARLAGTTKTGTSMKGLADAAYKLGMKATGMKINYKNLLELKFPIIGLLNGAKNTDAKHYIVIDKVDTNQVVIWDTNQGYVVLPKKEFEAKWDGYVLTIAPPVRQKSEKYVNAPNIEINESTYDFGTISPGDKIQHTFIIKNIGKKLLKILKVDSSCACQIVKLKNNTIQPGNSTTLDVTYQASGTKSKDSALVHLTTNDPSKSMVVVSLTGMITGIVRIYPHLFYLGSIGQEEIIEKSFAIYRPEYGTLKIKSVTSSSPKIKTRIEELKDNELMARIYFKLEPGLPLGSMREKVIVTTDAPKYPEIQVPIEGTIIGDLLFKPDQFFMGVIQSGTSVNRTAILENRGEADLKILRIESKLPIIQVKWEPIEQGKKYKIEATCTPIDSSTKSIKDTIRIYTNSALQPVLQIPLIAILK